jgi:phage terminase large subunit-like protein
MTFIHTDSAFGPIATKAESGHGEVVDWGGLDEAFKQVDNRVEAAWRPAMITKPMSQFWMVSTMGDATAIWFNDQVERARASVQADTGRGVCYIEYAADPDDEDYGNQEKWHTYMPALGITQTADKLQMEYEEMDLNEWRRAYMNQQVDAPSDQILPAEQWAAMVRTKEDAPRATRCVLVVDVAYDRSAASIAVAYELADGTPAVLIVDHGKGTSWVTERVLQLRDELDPVFTIADNKGPCGSIITELEAEYVPLYKTSQQELVAACSLIYDGVKDEKFVHYGQGPLNKAVQGAAKRELSDAWAWTRRKSQENAATDVSPLVAVTLAYWAQVKMGEHADYDWKDSFG